jgi:alpha-glucosidase (family GH31 glycosyl hydrolase)
MAGIRYSADGSFPRTLTAKFGFVRDDWPPEPFQLDWSPDGFDLRTRGIAVRITGDPPLVTVRDGRGALFSQTAPLEAPPGGGFRIAVRMAGDEHFYGLGFQRTALDARGHRLAWKRVYRCTEATLPFFMSTRGYGFYSNNTWAHVFDFREREHSWTVGAAGGQADYYVIAGPRFRDILGRYTALTGRPLLAPRWGLGLCYIARYFETQSGVLSIAERFRREDIPLDMIGLEPGWEEEPYSMRWEWSRSRFPDPAGMTAALARLGLKLV